MRWKMRPARQLTQAEADRRVRQGEVWTAWLVVIGLAYVCQYHWDVIGPDIRAVFGNTIFRAELGLTVFAGLVLGWRK